MYPVALRDRHTAPLSIVILPEVDISKTSSAAVGAVPPTHVDPVVQLPPPTSAVIVATYLSSKNNGVNVTVVEATFVSVINHLPKGANTGSY